MPNKTVYVIKNTSNNTILCKAAFFLHNMRFAALFCNVTKRRYVELYILRSKKIPGRRFPFPHLLNPKSSMICRRPRKFVPSKANGIRSMAKGDPSKGVSSIEGRVRSIKRRRRELVDRSVKGK